MTFLNLSEVEALAKAVLPAQTWDYYAGGANDELSLAANRRAFDEVALLPRVLVDVSRRDASCTLLGRTVPAPIVVAPMAFQLLAHPEGELGIARACSAVGLPMTVSTFATTSIEEVRAG